MNGTENPVLPDDVQAMFDHLLSGGEVPGPDWLGMVNKYGRIHETPAPETPPAPEQAQAAPQAPETVPPAVSEAPPAVLAPEVAVPPATTPAPDAPELLDTAAPVGAPDPLPENNPEPLPDVAEAAGEPDRAADGFTPGQ